MFLKIVGVDVGLDRDKKLLNMLENKIFGKNNIPKLLDFMKDGK